MDKKRKIYSKRIIALIGAIVLLCVGLIWIGNKTIHHLFPKKEAIENAADQSQETASFTFIGVGDNLLHDTIYRYFEYDTGTRAYLPIYENTLSYTQNADLAYINMETVCAGDEYGLSGYPNFNGPLEMIDALSQAGFDWFSISSNHSLDVGMGGMVAEMNYFSEQHPEASWTGAARSQEEADQPVIRTVNGINIGLASFTYGLNGYQKPVGADWLVDVYRKEDGSIDYDLIKTRIDALQEASDVQIVSIHWGDEYVSEITEEQRAIAQYMHELGVEVIIGTHPHVIEPVELIQTDNQTTLVYYSLGNFISAQDQDVTMVGGMADFQLNYDFATKETTFSSIRFIPTITYISPDLRTYRTNTIVEYTDEMANNQYLHVVYGHDLSKQWIKDYVRGILGEPEGIEVIYG